MRTFRLFLAVALVAAVGVAVIPTGASAATGKTSLSDFEKKQNKRIKKANRKANAAGDDIDALNAALDNVKATLKAVTDAAPQLISGLQALQSALEDQVAPALTAINDALTDPVTGLVGLNDARPQFGAFSGTGNNGGIIDATGRHGGQGPDHDAALVPGAPGMYVVDFNNNVSDKSWHVNVFPYGPGGTAPTATAVTCAADAYTDACTAALGFASANSYNENEFVLVQIGNGLSEVATGFNVTALSG